MASCSYRKRSVAQGRFCVVDEVLTADPVLKAVAGMPGALNVRREIGELAVNVMIKETPRCVKFFTGNGYLRRRLSRARRAF